MRTTGFLFLTIFASFSHSLKADDGGQLFTLYCSACHGADGKGATGGTFPPLAGSPWVEGDPKRTVGIVLKGLHGPVEVNGRGYNLEMPPQEAVLSDANISAILTYVHTAWENKGQIVSPELVAATRAEFKSRDKPWTASEILKLHPLPARETALKNLTSRVYKGNWNKLPDFDKLKAENIEEEHHGIISTDVASMKDNFGIVWEGDFEAPADGTYEFLLEADDGARVLLGSEKICEVDGIGPMDGNRSSKRQSTLKKGNNPIRIEYFQGAGDQGIRLGWKVADSKTWSWLSDNTDKPKQTWPNIPLIPKDGKTVIYRNFIAGTTPRAIGFGFPGGVNLVYSADNLAPELIWSGGFIDAGLHWTNRGQGNQQPSGTEVIKLTGSRYLPSEAVFKGYSLDPQGNPSFKIVIGSSILTDSWKPGSPGTLLRTLTLTGSTPLKIPLGNAAITGSEETILTPSKPTTITYQLK